MIKLQNLLVGILLYLVICSYIDALSILQTTQVRDGRDDSSSHNANPSEAILNTNDTGNRLDYVVIVLMENKNYGDIINDIASAPYLNRLASDNAIAANYFDVSNNLSLPNYLGLTTGQTFDSWSGCNKPPSSCTGYAPIPGPTIIDRLEGAGLTWKAYMESMPSNCYQNDFGQYVSRHDPFVYFSKIQNNLAECNRVVPTSPDASNLLQDLGSTTTASNLMWLTPNLCDDMHSCPISTGDTFLSRIVPEILNSFVFQAHRAALFITWDEGSNSTHMPAIWAGPSVKSNYTSQVTYNHYSFLKTLEVVWHLPSLTSNDAKASVMTDFFKGPQSAFTYVPVNPQPGQTVTFVGTISGGLPPYSSNWSFGDGTQVLGGTANHNYIGLGSYNVAFSARDWFNHTTYTTQTISVSATVAKLNSTKTPINDRGPTRNVQSAFLIWLGSPIPMSMIMGSAFVTVLMGMLFTRRKKR